MPFRSRTSLASSSTKQEHERPPSPAFSVENGSTTIALTPMSRSPCDKGLPTPVTQRVTASLARRKKRTRIDDNARMKGLRAYWEHFLRKMGSGTAPSSSSAFDDSTGEGSSSNRAKAAAAALQEEEDAPLDDVVVDREWADDVKTSSTTHSEQGQSPDKSGGSGQLGGTNTDQDSVAVRADGFWGSCLPLIWLRWRLWPFLLGFFCTRFLDEKSEEHYSKENWFLRKVRRCWSLLLHHPYSR